MIEIKNLTFSYPETDNIFFNFNEKIESGENVCLFAASGAGKTTLLRLIAGLEKPKSGKIIRPENLKISFCPQYSDLFEHLSAEKNVSLVCKKEQARAVLSLYGLGGCFNLKPFALSEGMKKRVSLARAVCFEPDILLLDESFTGLDEKIKRVIADDLLVRFKNKVIIFSSHNQEDIELLKARKIEF